MVADVTLQVYFQPLQCCIWYCQSRAKSWLLFTEIGMPDKMSLKTNENQQFLCSHAEHKLMQAPSAHQKGKQMWVRLVANSGPIYERNKNLKTHYLLQYSQGFFEANLLLGNNSCHLKITGLTSRKCLSIQISKIWIMRHWLVRSDKWTTFHVIG